MRLFKTIIRHFTASWQKGIAVTFFAGYFFLIVSSPVSSKTYYVDSSLGDDNYDGTHMEPQGNGVGPWKTTDKVNSTGFAPGDSILFKRGEVWYGGNLTPRNGGAAGETITVTDSVLGRPLIIDLVDPDDHNCLYIGAYGSGDKPRFECEGNRGLILRHNFIIVEDLHFNNGRNGTIRWERPGGNYWTNINNVDITRCSGNAIQYYEGGGNIWIKSLYIYDYAINGIYLNGSKDNSLKGVLVEDCWIEDPEVYDKEDAISCHRGSGDYNIEGDVIIRNNTIIRSGEDGIDITSGNNILVEGNHIRESYDSGILVGGNSRVTSVEVRGNFLSSNVVAKRGQGELRLGNASGVRVTNNILTGTGHNAILFDRASDMAIWNNIIAPENSTGSFFVFINEGSDGIDFKNNIFDFSRTSQQIERVSRSGLTFDNNCYFAREPSQKVYDGNSFWQARAEMAAFEPNGFFADPQFIDTLKSEPDHFRLKRESPCIDSGADIPVWLDFYKNQRPMGDRLDIGVFEEDVIIPGPDAGEGSVQGTGASIDLTPGIGIFPNPFQNYFHVTFGELGREMKKFKLVDINGVLVLEKEFNEFKQDYTFYLDDLNSGYYFLILIKENMKKFTYPMIKLK